MVILVILEMIFGPVEPSSEARTRRHSAMIFGVIFGPIEPSFERRPSGRYFDPVQPHPRRSSV